MSFSTKYFATLFVRCCRNVYEQLLTVNRAHIRPDSISKLPCSSMNLWGHKNHLAVNMRGIMCLSRLLLNRTVRSLRLNVFSEKNARFQVPLLVDGLRFKTRSVTSTTTLAFSNGGVTKRPYRDESNPSRGFPDRDDDFDGQQPLRLMEFREIVWPHPWKFFRNYLFSFLISSYFDDKFSIDSFLNGAEQVT
jgi:hypothetical protein